MPEPAPPPTIIKTHQKTLPEPFALKTDELGEKKVAKFQEKVHYDNNCMDFYALYYIPPTLQLCNIFNFHINLLTVCTTINLRIFNAPYMYM